MTINRVRNIIHSLNQISEFIKSQIKGKLQMSIYHYTKGYSVEGILKDGYINLEGTSGRSLVKPKKAFVWFTEKQSYPISALPMVAQLPYTHMQNYFGIACPTINWIELSKVIGGVFRFEFSKKDSRVEKWSKCAFRAKSGATRYYQMLEKTANLVGDYANKFWIAHEAMQLKNCTLQIFVSGEWINLLRFNNEGFVEQLSNYTLDDVIEICKDRLCA